MAYPDRLKDAFYEAPSGEQISFDFEEISTEIPLRIGSFEFSGVNGTLHQDKGRGGELYPFTVYVHGPDYDIEADRFKRLSKEIGNGFLNHPRYGRRRVQMLAFSVNEQLTKRAGQAVFSITWQESLEREFPKTAVTSQQQVTALADTAQTDAIENFAEQVDVSLLDNLVAHGKEIFASATKVNETLSSITSSDQGLAATFRGHIDNIFNNVNEYAIAPFDYAFQITAAIRTVAAVPGRISAKAEGFQNLLNILQLREITNPFIREKNAILVDEIVGATAMVAAGESINSALAETSSISFDEKGKATINAATADTGFQTRGEVLAAVVYLKNNSDSLTDYLDDTQVVFEDNILAESYIQTVQSYTPTWQVISTVIQAALELSFSLPVKRTEILKNDQTLFELGNKHYKNIDDVTLDYMIQTNGLAGDNIIAVPKDTEFIYYV